MGFLFFCDLGNKTATKAVTSNCVPLDIARARYTSSQTVFHNICSEHAVLFLCLYHFASKGRHEGCYD